MSDVAKSQTPIVCDFDCWDQTALWDEEQR